MQSRDLFFWNTAFKKKVLQIAWVGLYSSLKELSVWEADRNQETKGSIASGGIGKIMQPNSFRLGARAI